MDRCCCGFWKIVLSLILSCYLPRPSGAQNFPDTACKEELLKYTEQVYGPDDFIIMGRAYKNRNAGANGHPYFIDDEWNKAVIYSYGKQYRGISIRYNIETDEIIFRIIDTQGRPDFVSSEYATIDSFAFDDHLFINLQKINSSIAYKGYYEKVFKGDLLYVLKHKKQFVKNYNTINPYGFYSRQLSTLCIIQGDDLVVCPNRKSLLRYFSDNEKEIRSFMKQQHIHFRKAEKDDLMKLCRYIDKLTGIKDE